MPRNTPPPKKNLNHLAPSLTFNFIFLTGKFTGNDRHFEKPASSFADHFERFSARKDQAKTQQTKTSRDLAYVHWLFIYYTPFLIQKKKD